MTHTNLIDTDPIDANLIDANLAIAYTHLERALTELAHARDALYWLHQRDAADIARLRAWRNALTELGMPLCFGSLALHDAIQALASRTGDLPAVPAFGPWLVGFAPPSHGKPVNPTREQAQRLRDWLMPKIEPTLPRVWKMLDRDLKRIIMGHGGALVGLDSEGFLPELWQPGGGRIGVVVGIGPVALDMIRQVLGPIASV